MKEDLSKKLAAARESLNAALLKGDPTERLRAYVRELEAEAQRVANEEAAEEAAARAAKQSAEAEREAGIRATALTLQDARNARLDATRTYLTVRSIPDTRSSFV